MKVETTTQTVTNYVLTLNQEEAKTLRTLVFYITYKKDSVNKDYVNLIKDIFRNIHTPLESVSPYCDTYVELK